MKKILTVSLFAMMAVSTANADIASTKYVGDQITATAGTLTELTTAEKGNLVDAINELKDDMGTMQGGIGATIDPLVSRVTTAESNITSLRSDKADKATTLAGYGITDAYTKTYMDGELGKKQNNLNQTQMDAVNSGITTDKVTKYDGYDAKITAAKKAGDDAQATANSAVTVNTQQATAISGNTAAINTLKGDKTVTGSVAKSIDDAFTTANLSQYATTSTMNTELGKKQNNLSADQLSAVNSGITSDKVTKYDGYDTKISQNKSAITANTTSINTINNSAVMNSGVTADVVAKAKSAMQEANLKALESWTTGQCAEPTVTCSLISKGGKIAWEVVTY